MSTDDKNKFRFSMLIDTHCHLNMMIKKDFDRLLNKKEISAAQSIISDAHANNVTTIINVGTSLAESLNCIELAQQYPSVYSTVGIHPNDLTDEWRDDVARLATLLQQKEDNKIVGVGEIGVDRHYENYNLERQYDAFRTQIELALEHNIA